jgi:glyoxylase-like metal-dependent hydrolase (beta-lactamase superfamily II)
VKIFPHFSVVGFCNSYIIGGEEGGGCIMIDPGHIDEELISLLVSNHYVVQTVLLTHSHEAHVAGMGTLRKIYDPVVYAANPARYDFPVNRVEDDEVLSLCGFSVHAIHVPGHSLDSLAYLIDHAIFSGDTLEGGRIAATNGFMEQELLLSTIEKRLMTLDENFLLFPGHGSISKIRIERMFNQDLLKLRTIERARSLLRKEEDATDA